MLKNAMEMVFAVCTIRLVMKQDTHLAMSEEKGQSGANAQ
jgi:hypothetical protein